MPAIGSVHGFTDLDGDRLPDSIRYSLKGSDGVGFLYTVEFDMSARTHSASIGVHAGDAWGLQIVARDVDGDHDLDLVVTSGSHGQAVDVWLNDGRGGFTSGGVKAFPASIWIPERDLASSGALPVRELPLALSNNNGSAALMPKPASRLADAAAPLRLKAQTDQTDSPGLDGIRSRAPPSA